ncbi:MAG: hypothetical protein IPJ32_06935 [Sphingobacteriaceae bacterium]|nr:hypothetical protein [Sphingobacteriaceae bacterium]
MLSFNKEGKTFWLKTADSKQLKSSFSLFFGEAIWIVFLTLFLISIITLIILRKKSNKDQNLILIYSAFLSIGCICITYFVGMYKPIFLARYILFTVPFVLILLSHFITNLHKFAGIIFIPLIGLTIYSINLNPSKTMDFKLASLVVKKFKEQANPLVLIQTKDVTAIFAYYFDISNFKDYKNLTNNLQKQKIFELEDRLDLSTIPFNGENKIIFCQTFEKQDDNTKIFELFKQNNYIFTSTKIVKGVKISL